MLGTVLTISATDGLALETGTAAPLAEGIIVRGAASVEAIGPGDLKEALDGTTKPGKYSPAQKSMHAVVTILTLLVIGSGLIMFLQIDTPWWERSNSMSEATLGLVFFIHGVSTLGLIGVICLHVYFALRPEKLFYTRSMIKGWISKEELTANHDPQRWKTEKST